MGQVVAGQVVAGQVAVVPFRNGDEEFLPQVSAFPRPVLTKMGRYVIETFIYILPKRASLPRSNFASSGTEFSSEAGS
jgi:hypothetical protein